MPPVHKYKRIENSIVRKMQQAVSTAFKAVGSAIGAFFSFGRRQYTVMLVPHSEKKVFNLHVNLFSILFAVLLIGTILVSFVWYSVSYMDTGATLADRNEKLQNTQASLDQLRDETAQLLKAAKGFEAALSTTLSNLGLDKIRPSSNTGSGDLASFFELKETAEGSLKEVSEIRRLAGYLSSAVDPVTEIGDILNSQSALLSDIPNLWPIRGGIGHISMYFGQNENPFTGQWYLHKGLDLSTYRAGDPVVATANGQVVTVDYDIGGFGNYIIVRHKHGFYTRYAHLQSFRVSRGQMVQQGQIIGYIGNTGLSTGPHLHYEVHIGSDVVDPLKFLNIRNSTNASIR